MYSTVLKTLLYPHSPTHLCKLTHSAYPICKFPHQLFSKGSSTGHQMFLSPTFYPKFPLCFWNTPWGVNSIPYLSFSCFSLSPLALPRSKLHLFFHPDAPLPYRIKTNVLLHAGHTLITFHFIIQSQP